MPSVGASVTRFRGAHDGAAVVDAVRKSVIEEEVPPDCPKPFQLLSAPPPSAIDVPKPEPCVPTDNLPAVIHALRGDGVHVPTTAKCGQVVHGRALATLSSRLSQCQQHAKTSQTPSVHRRYLLSWSTKKGTTSPCQKGRPAARGEDRRRGEECARGAAAEKPRTTHATLPYHPRLLTGVLLAHSSHAASWTEGPPSRGYAASRLRLPPPRQNCPLAYLPALRCQALLQKWFEDPRPFLSVLVCSPEASPRTPAVPLETQLVVH